MDNIFIKKILLISLFLFASPLLAASDDSSDTKPTTSLEVLWDGKFIAGQPISGTIIIRDIKSGDVFSNDSLVLNNRRKIHLLVVDPTLKDFHHIHPVAAATPFAFNFTFTPKFSSSYRIWADIAPITTNKQELISGWIGDKESSFVERRVSDKTSMNGYNFVLSFDKTPKNGQTSIANVRITDYDNKPAQWSAEPYRQHSTAEITNIIGFYDDNAHVIKASQIINIEDTIKNVDGPDVKFKIEPKQSGFIKMFMQITLGGKEMFVPFAFYVE